MPAATIEQLIATHGAMIARHYGRTTTNFTTAEFIDTIASLGRTYSTGSTADLRTAGAELAAAANCLVDAELDPSTAAIPIAQANRRLQYVANLNLA